MIACYDKNYINQLNELNDKVWGAEKIKGMIKVHEAFLSSVDRNRAKVKGLVHYDNQKNAMANYLEVYFSHILDSFSTVKSYIVDAPLIINGCETNKTPDFLIADSKLKYHAECFIGNDDFFWREIPELIDYLTLREILEKVMTDYPFGIEFIVSGYGKVTDSIDLEQKIRCALDFLLKSDGRSTKLFECETKLEISKIIGPSEVIQLFAKYPSAGIMERAAKVKIEKYHATDFPILLVSGTDSSFLECREIESVSRALGFQQLSDGSDKKNSNVIGLLWLGRIVDHSEDNRNVKIVLNENYSGILPESLADIHRIAL